MSQNGYIANNRWHKHNTNIQQMRTAEGEQMYNPKQVRTTHEKTIWHEYYVQRQYYET